MCLITLCVWLHYYFVYSSIAHDCFSRGLFTWIPSSPGPQSGNVCLLFHILTNILLECKHEHMNMNIYNLTEALPLPPAYTNFYTTCTAAVLQLQKEKLNFHLFQSWNSWACPLTCVVKHSVTHTVWPQRKSQRKPYGNIRSRSKLSTWQKRANIVI